MSDANAFRDLEREFAIWASAGRRATLWWRDDDATRASAALRRLLAIATRHRTSVVVAAIPAAADASLVDAIAGCGWADVVQHGYAHANHAPARERSAELGADRAPGVCLAELARGRERLAGLFRARFVPMLVPPWNRIGGDLVPGLPSAGFAGLSTFGPRVLACPAPGLRQVNAHVDLIAWRRGRSFIGVDAALERLTRHLVARRTRGVDSDEPIGLLTHHLQLGDAAFEFIDELLARTRDRAGVAWLDAREALADAQSAASALVGSPHARDCAASLPPKGAEFAP